MAKKKTEIQSTSVRLKPLEAEFIQALGKKLSPGCEHLVRAYKMVHNATIPELKGVFTYRELSALLEIQKNFGNDITIFQADSCGYNTAIRLTEANTKILKELDVDEAKLCEKISTLTACQIFVLQEMFSAFIRLGRDDFSIYIADIVSVNV